MDKHGCVSRLKKLAQELGHTPSRDELRANEPDLERAIRATFGAHAVAIKAAGLDSVRVNEKEKKRAEARQKKEELKKLFQACVEEQLKRHAKAKRQLKPVKLKPGYRILVLGDTHFPFVHQATLNAVYDYAERFVPTHIIQVGDLYDMLAQSKFPRSLNVYTPKDEMELGQRMAAEMWATLKGIAPKAQCFQLRGNHDVRPLKRILEGFPAGELFFSVDRYFEFDGVTDVRDAREELVFQLPGGDLLAFHHGHASKLGQHRDHNLVSTVVGHTHKAGVVYKNMGFGRGTQFEANAGLIGDPESKALSHTQTKTTHWTLSFLDIDEYGPRVIAL